MLDEEQLWKAVIARDSSRAGEFVFGVRTTGVFCNPGCPARLPLRKNVTFYRNGGEAQQDGMRPCRRCFPATEAGRPPHTERIREICHWIEQHCDDGERITLNKLSEVAGLSPFHLQRSFKNVVGSSPKEYVELCRTRSLKRNLRSSASATEAIYASGYGSGSRVYERTDQLLGMTPVQYRDGGKGVSISYVFFDTPLGLALIAASDRGLCFLQFGQTRDELLSMLHREFSAARLEATRQPYPEQLKAWMRSLSDYLAGQKVSFDLPLDIQATAFQAKVWNYLRTIPEGEVRSYSDVAAQMGNAKSVRAVARACGANRIAIVIPCHRVVRGDGSLGGYRWGLDRKQQLIQRERAKSAAK